ncbi:MAG TPA: hypothetical protein VHP37_01950 [Burkholderiales bacterium]|nr:hypothetical protein [Burkholderiales bacterium]
MPAKAPAPSRALFLVACCALAAAVHAEPLPSTLAETPALNTLPPEVLERAFWICDHTATVQGIDATPIAACTSVFEALKETKFGGDFGELLAWWRANKLIEHTRLEAR